MKRKALYLTIAFCCIFLSDDFSFAAENWRAEPATGAVFRTPEFNFQSPAKSAVEEIKISGETIVTINDGDFSNPTFSPDGKKLAYSKTSVRDSEIWLYDFRGRSKFVLLTSKQSRKYAADGSWVSALEWLGANRLRAYLADGDVGTTILTFNTQTRRVIKSVSKTYDENEDTFPSGMRPTYLLLLKAFPEIEAEIAKSAFETQRVYEIGKRAVVLQFDHADADSNVWYFDFQTKKKHLLAEAPSEKEAEFKLIGALENSRRVLFLTEYKKETSFFSYEKGSISQLLKTDYKGSFHPLFSDAEKSIFLLHKPDEDSALKSSLWVFDRKNLKRASDVENLIEASVDATGKMVAFCYKTAGENWHISVRRLKTAI